MFTFPKNIICQTSTIADGNMSFRFGEELEVVGNRKNFLAKLGIVWNNHIAMKCNHGSTITPVNWSNCAAYLGADKQETMIEAEVLVTNEPDLALMLLTADCLPTTFYDPVQKVIALAHLNRKTIAHDLGQKTVAFMSEHYHSNPTDILVNIGPHIKTESYKFKPPLQDPAPPQLKDYIIEKDNHVHVDMVGAELAQLEKVGIESVNITISEIDTATNPKYFSHYRAKQAPTHPEGRMTTVVMMR